MSGEHLNAGPGMHLDADAVCAACGTVNPEGTLICKVCGNNLRDQRMRRLQAEQVLESGGEPAESRRWLAGLLTGVGAILVLIVALNVNYIAEVMVNGGAGGSGVSRLWKGDAASLFDGLRDELRLKAVPSEAEIEAAMALAVAAEEEGAEPPVVDGYYLLMPPNATPNAPPLGTAAVRTNETGEIAFVALLSAGSEVRGWGAQRSAVMLTAEADRCAMLVDNVYMPVFGFASREEGGSYSLWGQYQISEDDLQGFTAYRLP